MDTVRPPLPSSMPSQLNSIGQHPTKVHVALATLKAPIVRSSAKIFVGRSTPPAPQSSAILQKSPQTVFPVTIPETSSSPPLISNNQPTAAYRQPGGAENPKSYGGSGATPAATALGTAGSSTSDPLTTTTSSFGGAFSVPIGSSNTPPVPTNLKPTSNSSATAAASDVPQDQPSDAPGGPTSPGAPVAPIDPTPKGSPVSGNTEIPTPTSASEPSGITSGPDGNIWFTEFGADQIGKLDLQTGEITEYTVPTPGAEPLSIVTGPDGNLWFTEWNGRKIGQINPETGAISESETLPGNGHPYGIAAGTNGQIWFGEAGSGMVGEIDPDSFAITQFAVPTYSDYVGIAAGSDGAMWFTEGAANKIGRIDSSGNVTEYSIPTAGSYPLAIIAGSDGDLWFGEYDGNQIGQITTSGQITEYAIPSANSNVVLSGLTQRADGGIWFAESGTSLIGRLDPSTGDIAEYAEPSANTSPESITVGADNALYYTEYSASNIGRFYPTLITAGPAETITATATQTFSGEVVSFYDAYNATSDANLQSEITWGDGQTSAGTIVAQGSGQYIVTGSNTYAEGGTNPITLDIEDGDTEEDIAEGDPNGFEIDATATVADYGVLTTNASGGFSPGGGGLTYISATDAAPFDGIVGTFYDSDPNATADKYTISIDYGDGEGPQEAYALSDGLGDGGFNVYGDHDFVQAGFFDGTIDISETGGNSLTEDFYANVAEGDTVSAGDVPTVLITSPGVQAGMGQTAPNVVQGSRYTVGQFFNLVPATATTNYQIASLTWSYPSGAVKGYGRFDPGAGGVLRYIGGPNSQPNTQVQDVSDFAGATTWTMNGNNSIFCGSFYWGPSAEGLQTISLTATFNVFVNGANVGIYNTTDQVEVNVLQPTGNINVWNFANPGLATLNGRQAISLAAGTNIQQNKVINNIYGINFTATVNNTCAGPNNTVSNITGDAAVAQTVQVTASRSYSTPAVPTNTIVQNVVLPPKIPGAGTSPVVLDGAFPYPGSTGIQPVGSTINGLDAPAAAILFPGSPKSMSRTDVYQTTLFYRPPGGIWVPIGTIAWGWSGTLTFLSNVRFTAAYTRTPPTGVPQFKSAIDNTFFLSWSHKFEELVYQ